MYQLLKVENVGPLSAALLGIIQKWDTFGGERDLSKARIKFIVDLIKHNRFVRCDWAVCKCKSNGKKYRVNGQHTRRVLEMITAGDDPAYAELEFPEGVPVVISYYECDTPEDIANVFDNFDNGKSARKAEDKLGVYISQHDDLVGIDKKLVAKALAGVDYYRSHCNNVDVRYNDLDVDSAYNRGRFLVLDSVREFCDALHDFVNAPFTIWQQKSGITARLYQQWLEDEDDCRLLMEQMFYEVGHDTEKYAKKIRNACSRIGHDQGWYYRATGSYMNGALRNLDSLGREEVRKMVKEYIEEMNNQPEEAVV